MEPTRPSPEQRTALLATWEQYKAQNIDHPSDGAALRAARTEPRLMELLREQFVAGDFLGDRLREMGLSEAKVENYCFSLGRLCFGNPDVWTNFDRLMAHATEEVTRQEKRKLWSQTAVPQTPPAPTQMFTNWRTMAKNSVGPEGVFPMPMLHLVDGKLTCEALAVSGMDVYKRAIQLMGKNPEEVVFCVDHTSAEGQHLEFGDFLAVVWYVNGEFYTGVIDYQREGSCPEPAFREVRWDNNYWNHALREFPVEAMQKAVTA